MTLQECLETMYDNAKKERAANPNIIDFPFSHTAAARAIRIAARAARAQNPLSPGTYLCTECDRAATLVLDGLAFCDEDCAVSFQDW